MERVRDRSALGPWWLLVLVAFGVVAMHHAPIAHGGPSAMPPAVSAAHHSEGAHPPLPTTHGGETAIHVTHASAGDEPGTGHGLLHLCLAVLVAAAVVVLAWLTLWIGPDTSSHRSSVRTAIGRARPPLPVPRRLAVLCVLRL